ncbi:acyl-CoA N-acyltransferase [Cubamyces sp. BRFM 1775]|nr:acyl-CoA N-acyltransferase [Cubamyces sp. BRFM 1775]
MLGSSSMESSAVGQCSVESVELVLKLDDGRINQRDMLAAWDELLPFSAEAAIVNRPSLFEFANTHTLLFAAVLVPVVEIAVLPPRPPLPTERKRNGRRNRARHASPLEEKGDRSTNQMADGTDNPARAIGPRDRMKTAGVVYIAQSEIPREAYIGISILPTFRGKGIARRACHQLLEWAVNALQVHHIQARIMCSPHIDRARSLFTAVGFTYEGVQRRIVTDATGEWADVMHMGILDTIWCIHAERKSAANGPWDELLERHQREAEELLWAEMRQELETPCRTDSMETSLLSAISHKSSSRSPCADTNDSGGKRGVALFGAEAD